MNVFHRPDPLSLFVASIERLEAFRAALIATGARSAAEELATIIEDQHAVFALLSAEAALAARQ